MSGIVTARRRPSSSLYWVCQLVGSRATRLQLDTYMREMLTGGSIVVTDTSRALARAMLYPPNWYPAWPAFRAAQPLAIGLLPSSVRRAYRFEWHARRPEHSPAARRCYEPRCVCFRRSHASGQARGVESRPDDGRARVSIPCFRRSSFSPPSNPNGGRHLFHNHHQRSRSLSTTLKRTITVLTFSVALAATVKAQLVERGRPNSILGAPVVTDSTERAASVHQQ